MFKKLFLFFTISFCLVGCKDKDSFNDYTNVKILSYEYTEPKYETFELFDYKTETRSKASFMMAGSRMIPRTRQVPVYILGYNDLEGKYVSEEVSQEKYEESIGTGSIVVLTQKSKLNVNVQVLDEGLEKDNVYTISFREGLDFQEDTFKKYVGKDIVYKKFNKILKEK